MLLSFKEGEEILKKYQIPLVRSFLVNKKEELPQIIEEIGFPLVMKIDSGEIFHRTEKGGVITGIKSEKEALEGLERLLSIEKVQGVIVQKEVSGVEIVIGGKRDSVFGPVVMVGLGGILVELLKETVFRLAPLEEAEALDMIEEMRGNEILDGFRGKERVERKDLANLLYKTSLLIKEEEDIKELDFNPVIAGKEILVCDLKIVK